jgi:phosphonopyruvate decarboxylase
MLLADRFADAAKERGFSTWISVPCSYLQPLINHAIGDSSLKYVPAANEGDAVAIAAGIAVAGGRAVTMVQNSGLGNAVSPLTSLTFTHRIPLLLIVSLRGEPGGPLDEPQHALMGSVTTGMLDLMQVRHGYFPSTEDEVELCLNEALSHMEHEELPYCLKVRKQSASPLGPSGALRYNVPKLASPPRETRPGRARRAQMLAALQRAASERDILIATTGFTGRELYALGDQKNHLYLVGAMGCASSLGLGIALQRPDLRVIVLDGDGAALMRLGAMATIGNESPANLLHIVLDNGMHESTGGQPTASRSIDLASIATACGYRHAFVLDDPEQLATLVAGRTEQLTFVRAMIAPGTIENLPRPKLSPSEVTRRLRKHIRDLGDHRRSS